MFRRGRNLLVLLVGLLGGAFVAVGGQTFPVGAQTVPALPFDVTDCQAPHCAAVDFPASLHGNRQHLATPIPKPHVTLSPFSVPSTMGSASGGSVTSVMLAQSRRVKSRDGRLLTMPAGPYYVVTLLQQDPGQRMQSVFLPLSVKAAGAVTYYLVTCARANGVNSACAP